ncbi:HNH endonuclease [Bacillus velezensis]|nr:HNH endonuclease [Bacillus velezensis]MCR4367994.1 HNH endonuclease [Bacillus amyloliquefaciens]MCV3202426.1 HNH endonuclease [Bacillus velezensis]
MDRGVITAADVCDHIIPIEIRWDLRLTYSNLQMLCHSCHNRKTREDEKKYGKR